MHFVSITTDNSLVVLLESVGLRTLSLLFHLLNDVGFFSRRHGIPLVAWDVVIMVSLTA